MINLVFSATCSPFDLVRKASAGPPAAPVRPPQWMRCSDGDNEKEQQGLEKFNWASGTKASVTGETLEVALTAEILPNWKVAAVQMTSRY